MLRFVLSRSMLVCIALLTCAKLTAGVPIVLSHQGRLLDASDAPLSGSFTIIYSIYDAPVGGTQLWLEDHVGVVVADGLFTVQLGTSVPLSADIFAGSGGGGGGTAGRYLQVQISGQPPIMPRTQLLSSPYSVASSRLSGDVQTAPGELKASAAAGTKRIGIRVADSLAEASSIAIDEPGVQIAMRITPDSTVYDQGQNSGSRVMVHAVHRGENRISQTITPTTSSVAINTKGTGADRNRTIGNQCDDSSAVNYLDIDDDDDGHAEARGIIAVKSSTGSGSATASSQLLCDSDDDGLSDNEISQSVTPTTSSMAINTKGTGADANKTASIMVSATPGGSASAVSTVDTDGDDVPEGEISQSVTPMTSSMAINAKGTGAEANRTATINVSASPGGTVSAISTVDTDGDNDPEGEISQSITPTTCGVAINTKGTGAAKGRTAGSQCDDSSAVNYLDADEDGDGHAEARGIIAVKSPSGSGSASASSRLICDSDDDGLSDSEISQIVTPTTCGVAINTKGTGAAKGRTAGSQCDDSSAVHYLDIDDDGDDIPEVSLREAATPSVAEIVVTKNQDASSTDLRMAATDDTAVVVLGYDGLTTASLKLQVVSSGTANPIEHSSGAHLTAGGVWTNASDANLKENFRPVDGAELLEKIEELPVSEWNYKVESDAVTHIGPTAQDFQKVFGVGENDKSISTIDPSGIALAAIKELSKQNRELKDQNAKLMKKLEDLAKKVEKLTSSK